jgi:hypothetical protein
MTVNKKCVCSISHTNANVFINAYEMSSNVMSACRTKMCRRNIIIIFLHGLGRLTCSGIDALPSFPGASTIPSSPEFVCERVFRESGVVHSFEVVDPVLFVFKSYVVYSRDL